MITHAVFFWLKRPDSTEDRDQLINGVRGLAAIEVVRSLKVGIPAGTGARDVVDSSYDVSEIITFDNTADETIYQSHPLHEHFIAEYGHLWDRVMVYDIAQVG